MDENCARVAAKTVVHSLLYLVVKMVDEIEKVNILLLLHLLLNLLLDLLLNVRNLLLNVAENV